MVEEVECVLAGGTYGLSAAGGGDFYYEDNETYRRHFGKLAERHGFKGAFEGSFYRRHTAEARWGHLATFLSTTLGASLCGPTRLVQTHRDGCIAILELGVRLRNGAIKHMPASMSGLQVRGENIPTAHAAAGSSSHGCPTTRSRRARPGTRASGATSTSWRRGPSERRAEGAGRPQRRRLGGSSRRKCTARRRLTAAGCGNAQAFEPDGATRLPPHLCDLRFSQRPSARTPDDPCISVVSCHRRTRGCTLPPAAAIDRRRSL